MPLSDETMERWIGNLLRFGVLLSAVLVLGGGIAYLLHHAGAYPQYQSFQKREDVRGILGQVAGLSSRGVIQLGILILIATPVARVILAAIAFAIQRDRLYALVSLLVLGILLFSLLGS